MSSAAVASSSISNGGLIRRAARTRSSLMRSRKLGSASPARWRVPARRCRSSRPLRRRRWPVQLGQAGQDAVQAEPEVLVGVADGAGVRPVGEQAAEPGIPVRRQDPAEEAEVVARHGRAAVRDGRIQGEAGLLADVTRDQGDGAELVVGAQRGRRQGPEHALAPPEFVRCARRAGGGRQQHPRMPPIEVVDLPGGGGQRLAPPPGSEGGRPGGGAAAASRITTTRSFRERTCRYNDVVTVPRAAATRARCCSPIRAAFLPSRGPRRA